MSTTSRISQQIIATDGGNRSSSVELTVIITNVHNQPPQWEQAEYWVTIPENTVRDTKIVVSGASGRSRPPLGSTSTGSSKASGKTSPGLRASVGTFSETPIFHPLTFNLYIRT
ncbi:neural-cadherin-like [Arapaima gigas]